MIQQTKPFVVGTRFFEKNPENAKSSLEKLRNFCATALDSGAEKVIVAVNVAEDMSDAVGLVWNLNLNWDMDMERIRILPVTPWGRVVPALNAILVKGREYWAQGRYLLLASGEITLTREIAQTLLSHMNPFEGSGVLVAGAALPGHQYSKGGTIYPANGRQVPWNTLDVWYVPGLWRIGGFPLLGEGPLDEPHNAGVEELVTIASVQVSPFPMRAKLVEVPGVVWNTGDFDETRRAAHEKKMASKITRPEAQRKSAGIPGPYVTHC